MRFLVDEQLPRRLALWLRERGHEATHVLELGMEHAEDSEIWREAAVRGAVIVTKDEDFSVIVRTRIRPQVVWVHVGNCSNIKLLARMAETWSSLMSELEAGISLIEIR